MPLSTRRQQELMKHTNDNYNGALSSNASQRQQAERHVDAPPEINKFKIKNKKDVNKRIGVSFSLISRIIESSLSELKNKSSSG